MQMNRQRVLRAVLLMALFAVAACEEEEDDGVFVITDENFDAELGKGTPLMVNFYAPWCSHCKDMAEDYSLAAEELGNNDPPVLLAKYDTTEYKEVTKRYGIRGFPTILFFYKGEYVEYTGVRESEDFVNWVKRKLGEPSIETTCDELLAFVPESDKDLQVTYFGDLSHKDFTEVFQVAARNMNLQEKFRFYHTTDVSCVTKLKHSGNREILVQRRFDETVYPFVESEKTLEGFQKFLNRVWIPSSFEFLEEYIDIIFTDQKPAMFLFVKDTKEDSQLLKTYKQAAFQYRNEIFFVYSSIYEGIQEKLADYGFVFDYHLPTLRIIDASDDNTKYRYEGDLSKLEVQDVKNFVQDFKAKKLPVYYKSLEVPAENNGDLKVVVGKTFPQMVLENTGEVFIRFYGPWCGYSKKLEKKWVEFATLLKDVQGLTIMDIDNLNNEIEGISITNTPVLRLYSKDDKNKFVDLFGKDKDIPALKAHLKEHSEAYKAFLANNPEPISESEILQQEEDAKKEAARKEREEKKEL